MGFTNDKSNQIYDSFFLNTEPLLIISNGITNGPFATNKIYWKSI
jgi:hypothetical protein